MALSIDPNGSAVGFSHSAATSTTVTISTTNTNDIIICDVIDAASFSTMTVSSPSLTWIKWATGNPASNTLERWYAIASAALSGEVITVSGIGTGSAFTNVSVYSISGANTTTPFDSGGPVINNTGPDPYSITTSNANTMIIAFMLVNSSTPTAGAGYTQTNSAATFSMTEYQIISAAATTSVTIGTGVGTGTATLIDAVVQAGGPATINLGIIGLASAEW